MTCCARLMHEPMQPQSQWHTVQSRTTPLNSLFHNSAVQLCSPSPSLLHSQAAAIQSTQTPQAGSTRPLQQAITKSCQTCSNSKRDGPMPFLVQSCRWQCPCRMQVAPLTAPTVVLWPLCIYALMQKYLVYGSAALWKFDTRMQATMILFKAGLLPCRTVYSKSAS